MATNIASDPLLSVIRRREGLSVRVKKMRVVRTRPMTEYEIALTPPGTVTVLIARKGSGDLDKVLAVIAKGGEATKKFVTHFTEKRYLKKRALTRQQLASGLLHAPVQADIRHAGIVINSGQFLPNGGEKVVGNVFPFNGGMLSTQGFELVEYYTDDAKYELEGVVLQSDPPLTDAERVAMKLVPQDQRRGNVGAHPMDICDTTWAAVAGVALFVAAATLHVRCAIPIILLDKHLSEKELKDLSPGASARKLLQIRREIYLKAKKIMR